MDLNKIQFNKIQFNKIQKTNGINGDVENFNLNKNGVINSTDKILAVKNTTLSSQIDDVINTVDKNVEISCNLDYEETSLLLNNYSQTSQKTISASSKFERKTLAEYIEDLDSKYNKLYEMFNGDAEKMKQYVNNNAVDYADIDGDGKITLIDTVILDSYCNANPKTKLGGKSTPFSDLKKSLKKDVNTTLDLSELEDYFKLGGAKYNGLKFSNPEKMGEFLNISKIVQTDNWEEKLRNLINMYLPSSLNTNSSKMENIFNYLKKAETFAKENPSAAGYADLAARYQTHKEKTSKEIAKYEKMIKVMESDESLKKINENRARKGLPPLAESTPEEKEKFIESCKRKIAELTTGYEEEIDYDDNGTIDNVVIHKKKIPTIKLNDINGDGVFDCKDYDSFSTEIDLDGDGVVSDDEREVCKSLKTQIYCNLVYNMRNRAYANTLNIDDVISYAGESSLDENYGKFLVETVANIEPSRDENAKGYAGDWSNTLSILLGHLAPYLLKSRMSEIFPDEIMTNINNLTKKEYLDVLQNAYNYFNPLNLYKVYIQSANVSKEKLQEILEKINNVSDGNISLSLSEIKTEVQKRLAAMA